jgi:ribosome-associated translation inhibitor RaiA
VQVTEVVQLPIKIGFKGIDRSFALEEWIVTWATKLERLCDHLVGLDVTVEVPHRHHRQGKLFHVRLKLALSGTELVVSHETSGDGAHEDPYVAVRDAFLAMRRQLDDHLRTTRGEVKTHAMS